MTSVPVKKALTTLLRDPGNASCADCKSQSHPRWASWSLGVFICIKCAGVHRSLGTHISKVKSVDLDTWKEEHLKELVQMRNNVNANRVYEAKLPDSSKFNGKSLGNDINLLQEFIRQKYERKRWMDSSVDLSRDQPVVSQANSSSSSLVSTMSSSNESTNNTVAVEEKLKPQSTHSSSLLNLQGRKEIVENKRPARPTQQDTPQRNDLKKSILSLYSSANASKSNNNSTMNVSSGMSMTTPFNTTPQNNSSLSIDDDELFKNVWS
ncbi:ADP-ribosylation factor GTPase-activating protein effector protein 2 [Nakaseomyces glabratus]|uniref:ADP-ribosylation factor GTPase-activating protein effector protein 2 n=1 Tax=Candida glabrata TaxID=5478 RepID=A0A0W0D9R4_CANGB|nr:putative GTPase activating protein for Arf [Nakaseomyces glabratus]KAH7583850.1 putative GTPase activating protein for Arf [Nakaseomyces glabratus]KAH7590295.1 putative GTPase activating protein for Arf [Nakaseomyces glabratus]KAH7594861.1 putative GTPase activating protein for Arf [Nakaseomyces glabratus]KAH7610944.1 putative GTPase activating protein for Arf [Nakaseomyces glabratus]